MSELIQTHDSRATIRWKLLTGASALALTAYVSSAAMAKAEDTDHPALWIELGGQMEQVQSATSAFTAPFMSVTPTPDIYKGISFTGSQRLPRFSFGEESKISFQPEDSDWIFSAGVRYGRSHTNRHTHNQASAPPVLFTIHYVVFGYPGSYAPKLIYPSLDVVADTQTRASEHHLILDFTAGKDVGLGLFGHEGTSTIDAGVRIASFTANSATNISGRPAVNIPTGRYFSLYYGLIQVEKTQPPTFYHYAIAGHAARSFKGIGPTLSWNASAVIAGNSQGAELTFDWGINAALLFGKQKAKTDHSTQASHFVTFDTYSPVYYHGPYHSTRSRSVTVPNVGGFAGISLKWPNAKLSVGYRMDSFLNAMDTGIDAAKKSNLTFNGPYASISIGLGD